jgi:hypothetical protein
MATTKTAMVNKALTLVGANPIVNIDDEAENARIVNRVYETSLRSILSECKWNFATRRKLLAEASYEPEWTYTNEVYVYTKPADCIRIFGSNDNMATWREEGDYIFSDTTGLGLIYVYYLDSPSKYPAAFAEAFIDKLCSDIAYMVLNSRTVAEGFLEKYNKVSLPKAMAENAQTGTHLTLKDDAWEIAKYTNRSLDA